MSEYESNLDFIDLLDYFPPLHYEYSPLFQIHSQ